jgi:hypothetical protein
MEQYEFKTKSRRSSVRTMGTMVGTALVLGAAGLGCTTAESSTPAASQYTLTGPGTLTGPVIVIDDFKTGPGTLVETGVANQRTTQSGTGILGGTRCTVLNVTANPLGRPVEIEIRNGENNYLALDSGIKAGQVVGIIYGFNDRFFPGSLDIDLSNYQEFRIDFEALDLGTAGAAAVRSPNGGVSSALLGIQPGVGFTRHVPFSSFSGNVDWGHVYEISFTITSGGVVAAHDYAIRGISAGPAS